MMSTIGERLREAIELWPPEGKQRGVRRFQREMEARAAVLASGGQSLLGVSYPSINSYLNGETVPSIEFLREAADLLGVQFVWLVTGEGDRTRSEEMLRIARSRPHDAGAERSQHDDYHSVLTRHAPGYHFPEHVITLFHHVVSKCWAAEHMESLARGEPLPAPAELESVVLRQRADLSERLARLLFSPLQSWGVDMRGRQFDQYLVAMLLALQLSVPERGSLQPVLAE